jgi:hypothetical protein
MYRQIGDVGPVECARQPLACAAPVDFSFISFSYSLVQLVPLLLFLMAFFLFGVSVGIGHGAECVCRPLSGLSETSVAGSMFTLTTTTYIKETGIIFCFFRYITEPTEMITTLFWLLLPFYTVDGHLNG